MQREKEICKYSKLSKLAPALCLWRCSLRSGRCHQCNESAGLSSLENEFLFLLSHPPTLPYKAFTWKWKLFCSKYFLSVALMGKESPNKGWNTQHVQVWAWGTLLGEAPLCWSVPHLLKTRPLTSVPSPGHSSSCCRNNFGRVTQTKIQLGVTV